MNIASNPKNKKKIQMNVLISLSMLDFLPKKKKKKNSMLERVFIANITIGLCSRVLFKVVVNFRGRLVDVFKN